jgi:hypothetical protein
VRKLRLPRLPKQKLLKLKVPRGARASASANDDATSQDDTASPVYHAPVTPAGSSVLPDQSAPADQMDAGDTSSSQDNYYKKGGIVRGRAPADVAGDMGGSPGLAQPRRPR